MAKRRREIRRTDAEKFLARIQCISVLRSKRSGSGHAFDIRKQQASDSKRENSLHVPQPQRGTLQGRQAGRNLTRYRYAKSGQTED